MGKVVSWLLLIALGYLAYKVMIALRRKSELARRGEARSAATRDGERDRAAGAPAGGAGSDPAAGSTGAGERMVACTHCGVYVPESESVASGEARYCSAAHRDAGRTG